MRAFQDRLLPIALSLMDFTLILYFGWTSAPVHAFAADNNGSASSAAERNILTDAEKAAGWKLLFDGRATDGWRNFKKQDVSSGWKVVNGTLACTDPKKAGDIITKDKYDWFELSLEYSISEGGNSGVIFHSTEEESTSWMTGPEVQLFDNNQDLGHENQLSGWLYQLYKPSIDPKADKPIDATKPVGQWNHLRLIVTPQKCEVYMNDVKYYEFVLGSADWKDRVAKSKFAAMETFAKADSGHIALQGDHGQVSFRNIKIHHIEKP